MANDTIKDSVKSYSGLSLINGVWIDSIIPVETIEFIPPTSETTVGLRNNEPYITG